ncbi:MAG: hypothetical protein WAU70_12125 [Flavobacteriales bacterium]
MLRCLPLLLLLFAHAVKAQDTLRVMAYNLLDFPDPNPAGKVDTLAGILAWHPVDLLIAEEVHDANGAQMVLDQALNANGVDRFSMATFIPQQSASWTTIKLTQIIYYDHNKLGLRDQTFLYTDVRDINVYTLYLRDNGIFQGDTTFITVVGLHLKASNDQSDIDDRTNMVGILMDHLATLPAGRHVIIGGDFNIYTGNETAFSTLLTQAGNIQIADPLDLGGSDWYGSSYAGICTQSTRVNTLFGDGAGGGLDDRFDMLLTSDELLNGGSDLHLVPGSYRPLGNSGTCWNDNITDCSTSQTPYSILRKLYYMSDHLPITLKLASNTVLGIQAQANQGTGAATMVQAGRGVRIANCHGRAAFALFDMNGRSILQEHMLGTPGSRTVALPDDLHGAFVARLVSTSDALALRVVLE